jgi:hypothetical protein
MGDKTSPDAKVAGTARVQFSENLSSGEKGLEACLGASF